MSDLVVVEKPAEWDRLKQLVLDSVSSPITKRVYNMALDEFLAWFKLAPRPGFTKATVRAWRVSLEERRLGSPSIIVRMSAIRKLAAEAADNGVLAPELAAGIARVKSAKSVGIRMGNWLSARQAQTLLNAPDITTFRGLRDRAIIAVLLGCGLRRSEVAALTFAHIQQRDGRWCIVDLLGKHGRIRTTPMPNWVKVAIDSWTSSAKTAEGHVFWPVLRGNRVSGERLGEKVVWQMLREYAVEIGIPGLAPHDLRSCAKLCRAAGGELEQIQMLLGHASVRESWPWVFRYGSDEIRPDGTTKAARKYQSVGPSKGDGAITKKQAEIERDKFLAKLNAPTTEEAIHQVAATGHRAIWRGRQDVRGWLPRPRKPNLEADAREGNVLSQRVHCSAMGQASLEPNSAESGRGLAAHHIRFMVDYARSARHHEPHLLLRRRARTMGGRTAQPCQQGEARQKAA